VAVDLGCSWNQTSGDLQGVEEKTRKRRIREIILDHWIWGDTWQRSTHIRGLGTRKMEVKTRVNTQGVGSQNNPSRPSSKDTW
jgi:hypothetical protein